MIDPIAVIDAMTRWLRIAVGADGDTADSAESKSEPRPDAPDELSVFGWEWPSVHPVLDQVLGLAAAAGAALLTFAIVRAIVLPPIKAVVAKSSFRWDDLLFHGKVLSRVSWIPALLVARIGLDAFAGLNASVVIATSNLLEALLIVTGALVLSAVLDAGNAIYSRLERAKRRPIKGYLQIAKIFLSIAATVIVIATLMDRDPMIFVTGIGAMTAVLLLIFKDTILSLVASVTLTSNDMIRVGDWIEMPSGEANGDIIDISLHTVKVRNFDKTISTIPTYRLISESFKNWRGMKEAGGRRIKRAVNLDMSTIHFLDDAEIERFGRFVLLKDYIAGKQAELERYNAEHGADTDPDIVANARRLTNVGTFRAYVVNYLRSLPTIHQEGLTFLVRQLPATEHGLPIEIYVFTTTTVWPEYEGIQSDIFDHILAIAPEFGLRIFQAPAGSDVAHAVERLAAREG